MAVKFTDNQATLLEVPSCVHFKTNRAIIDHCGSVIICNIAYHPSRAMVVFYIFF